MSKYSMQYQELMKQQRRLDAIVCNNNHVAVQINADVNENNLLKKEYVIKDLFGILVILIVNVINYALLENIQIKKGVEKTN